MTFGECVVVCAGEPSFVREFDRLSGHHLSSITSRSALETMIDEATGRDREACMAFLAFVWEFIWTRIDWRPPEGGKVTATPPGSEVKRDDGLTDHPGGLADSEDRADG